MRTNILKNFIVFEGLDGAGTTTQAKLLTQNLPNSIFTFEPTKSEIGKLLRNILQGTFNFHPDAIANLFVADRAEHLFGDNGIVSSCQTNKIVICDRYLFSTLAYQSAQTDFDVLFQLNKGFPIPEVVFFLDTDLNECQKRISNRSGVREIYDDYEVQKKVLANYYKSFDKYRDLGANIKILNGNSSIENLLQEELKFLNR